MPNKHILRLTTRSLRSITLSDTGDITMMLRADCIISTSGIMTLRRVGLLALNQMLIRQSLMMESVYIALMFTLIVGIILSHTKMLAENLLFLYLLALAH